MLSCMRGAEGEGVVAEAGCLLAHIACFSFLSHSVPKVGRCWPGKKPLSGTLKGGISMLPQSVVEYVPPNFGHQGTGRPPPPSLIPFQVLATSFYSIFVSPTCAPLRQKNLGFLHCGRIPRARSSRHGCGWMHNTQEKGKQKGVFSHMVDGLPQWIVLLQNFIFHRLGQRGLQSHISKDVLQRHTDASQFFIFLLQNLHWKYSLNWRWGKFIFKLKGK